MKKFHKALEIDPNYTLAHFGLAIILNSLNRADEALTSYKKIVELDPTDAQAYSNMASIQEDLDMFE